jgi:hypothetical protein
LGCPFFVFVFVFVFLFLFLSFRIHNSLLLELIVLSWKLQMQHEKFFSTNYKVCLNKFEISLLLLFSLLFSWRILF